jgi:hypothetical protein
MGGITLLLNQITAGERVKSVGLVILYIKYAKVPKNMHFLGILEATQVILNIITAVFSK